MPNTVMAADAVKVSVIVCAVCGNFPDKLFMTIQAIRIQDSGIRGFYANRLMEVLKCEGNGVMVSIAGLGCPLANEIMRHVAIPACCKSMMTGLLPAVILASHNMAVDAGLRIIGKIRRSTGIKKSVPAGAKENSEK